MEPVPFASLLPRYRVFFFDAFGVLNRGPRLLPGVRELLARLPAQGHGCWIITNDASRSPTRLAEKYGGAVPAAQVVSAGLLAAEHLSRAHPGRRVAYLGPPGCADGFAERGHPVVPFPRAEFPEVEVLALMDEDGWDWSRELNRALNLLRARPQLPFYAPNPDLIFPRAEGGVGLTIGSLAGLLERALGRAPLRFGKPDPGIFAHALELARRELPDLQPGEVLMLGDTLTTDIAGAQRVGLASALVLSGNTGPDDYRAAIAASGIQPDHVVPGLG